MVTEILIGVFSFVFGSVVGGLFTSKLLLNANKLYFKETGCDFVSWIFNKGNEIKLKEVQDDLNKVDAKD